MWPTTAIEHQSAGRAFLLAALALCVAWGAHSEESPASMHARVSVELGGAVVKGDSDDDWSFATVNTLILPGDTFWVEEEGIAEVEFSGGSFLRLADNSKTQIESIYPSPAVEGWTGSFYVHRLNRSLGDFVFKTPAASIDVANDSLVRIDVIGEGATTVSVRFGHADVYAPGGERVRAHQGQRVFVDPGLLPSEPVPFDLSEEDDFDAWNRERVHLLVVGDEPVQSIPRSSSTPIGYADLAANGDWVYVDNRQYWRPTSVVDYVPYRSGYWSYVPSYGHVWCGTYPFSYVTSHYGRWTYNNRHGWLWCYDDVWGPAWVASYRYHDRYFWTPIDFYGRPVHYGHATFHIGDFVISIGATSYAYSHLQHGYNSVYPCYNDFFNDIHVGINYHDGYYSQTIPNQYLGVNGIHAWNIFAGDLVRNYRPNLGSGVLVRDYTPRRVIRGLRSGQGGGTAVARARRLERGTGLTTFAQASPRSVRGGTARTAGASSVRSARTRSAALPQAAIRDTSDAVARVERSRGVSSTDTVRSARAVRGGSGTVAPTPTRERTSSTARSARATERTSPTVRSGRATERTSPTVRSGRATERTSTTNRSRFSSSSPRGTTRSTATSPSVRSTESVRSARGTTPTRTTATGRTSPTRSVALPQRTGRERGTTMRSTRESTSRIASRPRATTSTTSPRVTTTTRSRAPERLSSPTVRTSRNSTPPSTSPRVTTPPSVRTPSGSTSPRTVSSPRAVQDSRTTTRPNVSTSPRSTSGPRVTTPPTRNTTPRVSVNTPPRPNVSSPRVSTPSRRSSSSPPRVSSPPSRNSAPRISAPSRSSAPRISAPSRSSAPRISAPSRSSAPRISAPSRSSAPRISSSPSRSSSRMSSPSRGSSSSRSSSFRGRSPRGR